MTPNSAFDPAQLLQQHGTSGRVGELDGVPPDEQVVPTAGTVGERQHGRRIGGTQDSGTDLAVQQVPLGLHLG